MRADSVSPKEDNLPKSGEPGRADGGAFRERRARRKRSTAEFPPCLSPSRTTPGIRKLLRIDRMGRSGVKVRDRRVAPSSSLLSAAEPAEEGFCGWRPDHPNQPAGERHPHPSRCLSLIRVSRVSVSVFGSATHDNSNQRLNANLLACCGKRARVALPREAV